jgi:hypothetical protein
MQKVVGSNPISRFREGLRLQAFFVRAVGWCVCVAGYPFGTRAAARSESPQKASCLQALVDGSTSDLLPCRGPFRVGVLGWFGSGSLATAVAARTSSDAPPSRPWRERVGRSARALAPLTVAALGPWSNYMRTKLGDSELHQDAATSVAHLNARLIRCCRLKMLPPARPMLQGTAQACGHG